MPDGRRKSIQAMAARSLDGDEQDVQQFVNQSTWDPVPVQSRLVERMLPLIEPTAWAVDDVSVPKDCRESVGMAPQYGGALVIRTARDVAPSLTERLLFECGAISHIGSVPGTPEAGFVPAEPSDTDMQRQWAERLAENDENILARLVADQHPGRAELLQSLRAQTNAALVQPVVFGSSITGAGDGSPFRGRIRSLEVVAPDGEGGRRLTVGHIASIGGLPRLRIGDRLGGGEAPLSR